MEVDMIYLNNKMDSIMYVMYIIKWTKGLKIPVNALWIVLSISNTLSIYCKHLWTVV